MSTYVPQNIAETVRIRAKHRCEYCQTPFWLVGQTFHIDHILPVSGGGETELANLCYACPNCNGAKSNNTLRFDPQLQLEVPLFNPREHEWIDHFSWDDDGRKLLGKSPIGRVTIDALRMNRPSMLRLRAFWVTWGEHPPS